MDVQGKTIFITGGVSGLGAACARRLTQAGAHVAVVDLNDELGHSFVKELGEQAYFAHANVSDEADIQNALRSTLEHFGGLHGVINCAGIGTPNKVLGKNGPSSLEAFTRVINVNLIGTFNVIRLATAVLSENQPDTNGERGVIVNTASVAAFDGQIGQAAYSASKGGIVGMTLPIARELARYGIRVMTVAPGLFDTPLMAGLPEAARESLGQQVPFPPRLGKPDEYAALVFHIFENVMLNGETIRLDGAIRMAPK